MAAFVATKKFIIIIVITVTIITINIIIIFISYIIDTTVISYWRWNSYALIIKGKVAQIKASFETCLHEMMSN